MAATPSPSLYVALGAARAHARTRRFMYWGGIDVHLGTQSNRLERLEFLRRGLHVGRNGMRGK